MLREPSAEFNRNNEPIKRSVITNKTIHNLSKHQLSETVKSVPDKAINYVIAPKIIPIKEIVANVEFETNLI